MMVKEVIMAWLCVVPPAAAVLGLGGAWAGSAVSVLAVVASWVWFGVPDFVKVVTEAVPNLAACVAAVLSAGKLSRIKTEFRTQEGDLKNEIEQISVLQQEAKASVVNFEQEEKRALHIYGLAKGLAESLAWGPMAQRAMAPKIVEAISQAFGTRDMLLYALDDEGKLMPKITQGRIQDAPDPAATPVRKPYFESNYLCVPIWLKEELSGFLYVKVTDTSIPRESLLSLAEDLNDPLAIGLKKARLFSQVETLSRIDGLTGVLRRQSFLESVQEELSRANLFQYGFSLIMLDIDHFKKINDTYGHTAGDAVLSKIGSLLKGNVYETDVVGRYGGEEFLILFSRADPSGVYHKAELLRQKVAGETVYAGPDVIKVTISIGIAHYPKDGYSLKQLLDKADAGLYMAKARGRNQVVEA